MAEELYSRGGLSLCAHTNNSELDFEGLCRLTDESWRHDYPGVVRILYNERYLRWLLDGADWMGSVITDTRTSQPVACVFALFRTLLFDGEPLRAAYSTQWTVSPRYRRFGLAMWLAHWNRKILLERARRAVHIGMLHAGHAGERSLGLFRHEKNVDGVRFPLGVLWSKRLDDSRQEGAARSSPGTASGTRWHVRQIGPEDRGLLGQLIYSGHMLSFSPTESFSRLYLSTDPAASGTYLCTLGAAKCAVSYSIHSLAIDTGELGRAGQIQCVYTAGCDSDMLIAALLEVLAQLKERGCVIACVLDQGRIDTNTLSRLGFTPSADRLSLNISAQPSVVQRLQYLRPPFEIDFI